MLSWLKMIPTARKLIQLSINLWLEVYYMQQELHAQIKRMLLGWFQNLIQHQRKHTLQQIKGFFRYLKGTIDIKLQYRSTSEKLLGYSDADWANDIDNRYSTTDNVFIMSGGAISWLSQKQSTVALSTAEAEYIALGSATQEAIWLNQLLTDLRIDTKGSIEILEDNQSAIAMAKNSTGQNTLTSSITLWKKLYKLELLV